MKKDSHLIDDYKIAFNDTYFQLNDKSDYYLDGYWQDERYFYCVRKKIMDEFSFNKNIYLKNKELINQLALENSIGVHIRRGDYVNTGFDITRIDYYKKAIEFISNKTKKPIFYFFSDDVGYVKKKFDFISNKKIITGNTGVNSYIDMFLMSKCRHNIIANSSFSYWGAYLNKNINKIVVAPRYFSTEIKRPLACQDWVIL
ncbi:alpha-1,2-fucosyltransferase [Pectinatus frisingensis]|nr:alpha-1,2-fucosyltransferase [Pectinatus frisingensis]